MVSTVVGVDIVEHLAAFSSEVSIEFRSLEVRIVLLHVEAVGLDVTILGVEVEGLGSAPGKDRKIEDRKFALDAVNVDPLGREDLFTIEDDLLEVGLVEGQTGIGFAIFDEQLCRSGQLPGTAGQVVVDVELTVREVDVNGLDFGAELVGLGFGRVNQADIVIIDVNDDSNILSGLFDGDFFFFEVLGDDIVVGLVFGCHILLVIGLGGLAGRSSFVSEGSHRQNKSNDHCHSSQDGSD